MSVTTVTQLLILDERTEVKMSLVITPGHFSAMATVTGEPIAFLDVTQHPTAEVEHVETHPDWQRRGIATALLALASPHIGPIAHSATRSPQGDVWAKSTGNVLPGLVPVGALDCSWT